MMQYLVLLFFLSLSFFAIYKVKMFGARGISKHWFAGAFALKLLAALLMYNIYTQHYPLRSKADIFRYYDDAIALKRLLPDHKKEYFSLFFSEGGDSEIAKQAILRTNNWESKQKSDLFGSNRLIIRLNMLISLFSLGSYGVHALVFSFMSFMGLFWIFRFFYRQLPEKKWLIFIAVFAFPSIVFWSSGILKESMIFFFMGLILNCGGYALKGRNPVIRSIIVLLGFVLLFQTRAISALLLFPFALAYSWNYLKPQRIAFLPYFIVILIGISFLSESKQITGTDFYGLLLEKQAAFKQVAEENNAGSIIMNTEFTADGLSVLANTPGALVNSLFRPTPWEAKNLLMWMAALENILIFLLLLGIVISPAGKINNPNLLWFSLLFALAALVVVGLSTPVLGAISRYRIIGLLFLLMSFIQLGELPKRIR